MPGEIAWRRPNRSSAARRRSISSNRGPADTQAENALRGLADLYEQQLRHAEAEACYRQALEISIKAHGRMHGKTCVWLNNLASVCKLQGHYAEAERLYREALEISETVYGPESIDTAANLNNVAALYCDLGRYAEVEPLYRRAVEIFRKAKGREYTAAGIGLNNLGRLYATLGRYAEAEITYKQALAILEKADGPEGSFTAACLYNLAAAYEEQQRASEALPLDQRAFEIRLKAFGRENPQTINSLGHLAGVFADLGHAEEAERLYLEAVAMNRKVLGDDHPETAASLNQVGRFYGHQRRFAEAEKWLRQSLASKEKRLGHDHPDVGTSLLTLTWVVVSQGRTAEALPMAERTVAIFTAAGTAPSTMHKSYYLRAQILWLLNRREEAVADLKRALEQAEQQRGLAGGSEFERSQVFGQFTNAYEAMLAWQVEQGDVGEALAAVERSRARSLLDEMTVSGADLDIGRPAAEREELRQREAELKTRIASLQKQLGLGELSAGDRKRIEAELPAANEALYRHYRDRRSSSPVYRQLLAAGSGLLKLKEVQQDLSANNSLLLEYFFGDLGGYVIVIGPDKARLTALAVDEETARRSESTLVL